MTLVWWCVVAVMVMGLISTYRTWHRQWGATLHEVDARMAGDQLIPEPAYTATRAITIDAPPEAVWPWIVRVGFHRHQHPGMVDVDDPMSELPDAHNPFAISNIDPMRQLVWYQPDRTTWSWELVPLAGGRTRLINRVRSSYMPLRCLPMTLVLTELGDFPVMRRMLLATKARAERRGSLVWH